MIYSPACVQIKCDVYLNCLCVLEEGGQQTVGNARVERETARAGEIESVRVFSIHLHAFIWHTLTFATKSKGLACVRQSALCPIPSSLWKRQSLPVAY